MSTQRPKLEDYNFARNQYLIGECWKVPGTIAGVSLYILGASSITVTNSSGVKSALFSAATKKALIVASVFCTLSSCYAIHLSSIGWQGMAQYRANAFMYELEEGMNRRSSVNTNRFFFYILNSYKDCLKKS